MTALDDQVEVRDGQSREVLWAGRLEDVGEATSAAVPPPEPEPEPEPEPPPPSRLEQLMASQRRRTFDTERGAGVKPTLSAADVAFVRNLREAPGGIDPEGSWLLPSGLPLYGHEIAELDEP